MATATAPARATLTRMTRTRGSLAAVMVLLVSIASSLTSPASPASASVPPTYVMSMSATVLYFGCEEYDLSYTATTTADTTTWDLTIFDSGSGMPGNFQATGSGGVYTFTLCNGENPSGRYDVVGPLTQCDASGRDCATTEVQYYFNLRGAHTKTTLSAAPERPRFNQVVTLTMRGTAEAARGYVGIPDVRLYLQVLVNDRWRRVEASTETSNGRGVAKQRYRWNVRGPVRVRAVCILGSGIGHKEKASRPVTIRVR